MVKKLLKHEFIYYIRSFGLFLPIVLVIGVMARVFRCFGDDTTVNRIMIFSSSMMLIVSCAALVILASVIGIVRFYKNMFSAEGYLTFTLPVTNAEHIFVKLLVAVVFQAICMIVVVAAGAIALSGEALDELWRDFYFIFASIFEGVGTANTVGFIIEWVLLVVISAVASMLLFYACITIGQTAKKNRIIKAIGAYFVYYIITQIASTVFTIIFTVLGMNDALEGLIEWVAYHPIATMHLYFCGTILLNGGLAALFWFITHRIMTNKLNLE